MPRLLKVIYYILFDNLQIIIQNKLHNIYSTFLDILLKRKGKERVNDILTNGDKGAYPKQV